MKVIRYPNAQCWKLVEAVRKLSLILDRPVCSKDVADYFKANPEEQPVLLQRIGQQLIKTARPMPIGIPRVYPIGIVGNRCFYVANPHPAWNGKLKSYQAHLTINCALNEDLPGHAQVLFGTSDILLARNAITGWCLELNFWLKMIRDKEIADLVRKAVGAARPQGLPKFMRRQPTHLIDRKDAVLLLRSEIERRAPFYLESKINFNRYLAGLAWPQSVLFEPKLGALVYNPSQILALAASRWPDLGEHPALAYARLLALKYPL